MIALPLAALSGLRNEQMVGALVVAGSSSAVVVLLWQKIWDTKERLPRVWSCLLRWEVLLL